MKKYRITTAIIFFTCAAALLSSCNEEAGNDDAPAAGTTLKTDDEKAVVSTSKLDLPASWPKDIPVPEDAKIQIKMELPTGGHKLTYGTQKSVDDMAAYYQAEMKKLGWADPSSTNAGTSTMLTFKDSNGRMVMINASNSSGVATAVSITTMVKK